MCTWDWSDGIAGRITVNRLPWFIFAGDAHDAAVALDEALHDGEADAPPPYSRVDDESTW
jgi:hypothetical protein